MPRFPRYSPPAGSGVPNRFRVPVGKPRTNLRDPVPAATGLNASLPPGPVQVTGQVTLDASGNGSVAVGPSPGEIWQLQSATVNIAGATKHPTCQVSLGSAAAPYQVIDTAQQGDADSTGKVSGIPVYFGTYVWAEWVGGNAGLLATLTVIGTKST